MLPSLTKPQVHQACLALLRSKITALEISIQETHQAASEETKSSAGDKYETSREMMTQEIEKASAQAETLARMEERLSQAQPRQRQDRVAFGSLVHSSEGWYYLSVSLGKLSVEGQTVYALSLTSPLGEALKGKAAGETISFRGREVRIEAVQ